MGNSSWVANIRNIKIILYNITNKTFKNTGKKSNNKYRKNFGKQRQQVLIQSKNVKKT